MPEVLLEKLSPEHAQTLARLANNRKIWDNVRDFFPHPYTERHAIEFIDQQAKYDPAIQLAIMADGEFAGVVGIVPKTDVFRKTGLLGYWLGEPYWGQGIATQAVSLAVTHAFDVLRLVRLQAGVFAYNKASARVLEKCGFEFEANFKKAAIKNDQIVDDLIYARINPNYQKE